MPNEIYFIIPVLLNKLIKEVYLPLFLTPYMLMGV
ncbi:hypothetical protein DVJ93_05160 [Staphylococcus aureus]|uniref:Uncharacterized protein n=1 Tax=Staphylococcus aureus TaxID=1280 RepID=A0A7Z1MZA1_STAAU|nr:hypothetical protein [Staphylococcus aureus]PPJ67833.1 hypothetical protein CV018_01605 [Staphylococcus aureus]PPJ69837.1 hypothetical protein CV021_14770 [Staphylococcus aureus]